MSNMAQPPKYAQVMSVIERRLQEGDYLLHNIPGERRIAAETGVSYMTARRAVIELLAKKVLVRQPNGSLDVHPAYVRRARHAKVVLLYPAYPSPYLTHLRQIVSSTLEHRQLGLRPVQYVHWDDPIVVDAVAGSGGALVIPSTESIPANVLSSIRANRVVMLDGDFSEDGIPSIQLFPDAHLEQVFAHLKDLGHCRIDCINTQHRNPEIDRRIQLWHKWLTDHDATGQLWDNPAPSFADPTSFAYEMTGRLIDEESSQATALVCTTFPAAIAAVRANWERGRRVGLDVSVCALNIEYPARYCCPSITGLDMPDLSAVLGVCFDWFSDDKPWRGPALLEPAEPVLYIGESSGRCRAGL
jgi:DNA-binding LacI/PurR family transcriptional regulator